MTDQRVLVFGGTVAVGLAWTSALLRAGLEPVHTRTVDEVAAQCLCSKLHGVPIALLVVAHPAGGFATELACALDPSPRVLVAPADEDPRAVAAGVLELLDPTLANARRSASILTAACELHRLSPRESLVLILGVSGIHDKLAADALGCTCEMIKTQWKRIGRKMRAGDAQRSSRCSSVRPRSWADSGYTRQGDARPGHAAALRLHKTLRS